MCYTAEKQAEVVSRGVEPVQCTCMTGCEPVRKGSSSVRVLSSPRARAMVESFLMEFKRNCRPRKRDDADM